MTLVEGERGGVIHRCLEEDRRTLQSAQSLFGGVHQARAKPRAPRFRQHVNGDDVPLAVAVMVHYYEASDFPAKLPHQRERVFAPDVKSQLTPCVGNPSRKASLVDLPQGFEVGGTIFTDDGLHGFR